MFLLAKASKSIPIGTAYPVWTGIGAVGTVLIGILVFKEPASFWRLLFITTLIASVVGLKNPLLRRRSLSRRNDSLDYYDKVFIDRNGPSGAA